MRKEAFTAGSPELSSELQSAFTEVFVSRTDRYPLQKSDGSYRSTLTPLIPQIVSAHLRGLITIGTYALDKRNNAKWLCLDADTDEAWAQLHAMAHKLLDIDVPTYLETSRRGGHIWLFFEKSQSGEDTRRFARRLVEHHEVTNVEIYPKQDRLQTGPGSLVRLPLGIHRLTNRIYPFVTQDGNLLAPNVAEQAAILAHPKRVPVSFIKHMLQQIPGEPRVFPSRPFIQRDSAVYGKTPSERIKNYISVVDFVGHYVDLNEEGRGLCPFHADHVNSFGVNAARNYWHCFAGCGGGSIIDFWMRWRKLNGQDESFAATVKDLARLLLK